MIALAAPAPAFAASCTELYPATLDWGAAGAYTRTDSSNGTGKLTAKNGVPITVTLQSVFTNYTPATTGVRPTSNLAVTPIDGQTPPTIGGIGAAALTLTQTANANGTSFYTGDSANRQAITFSFTNTSTGAALKVYRVAFTVTDIDSANTQYDDSIAIIDQTNSGNVPTGSTVAGAGTLASPVAQANNNTAYDNFSSNGGNYNVVIANAAGSSSFRLVYWNKIPPASVTNANKTTLQTTYVSTLTAYAKNVGC